MAKYVEVTLKINVKVDGIDDADIDRAVEEASSSACDTLNSKLEGSEILDSYANFDVYDGD